MKMSLILACLILAGCAHKLCHPIKTQEDYKRESYECEEEAIKRSFMWGNAGLLFLRDSERERCLKEKFGWRDCANSTAAVQAAREVPAAAPIQIAPQVYTHTVRQTFGGGQSPDEARTAAVARAKREVLEKAGTYVESLSEVREGQVTRDEVLAMAAGVFRSEIVSERNYVDGQAFGIEVTARVEVDPGVLREMVANRQASRKSQDTEPKTAKDYHSRGMIRGQQGQYALAISDFDQAILLDSKSAASYSNRGWAYKALQQYERAIQDFDQAIRLDPSLAQAYYLRGNVYFELHQEERAIQDYDKAITLDPAFAEAYQNRGIACTQLWQHERAIEDFTQAIRLNPRSSASFNARGLAYLILKNEGAGCLDLETACRLGNCGGIEQARKHGQCR